MLQRDPLLAPHTLARHFADFEFRFRAEVQAPEVFLSTRSGDCDDYATLAADLLKGRGYTPRLIAVRMKKVVHVVCYVAEASGYLDYNKRASSEGLVYSGSTLPEIAEKVAASYGATWLSTSEFTYANGLKRLVRTVLPGDPVQAHGLTHSGKSTDRTSS